MVDYEKSGRCEAVMRYLNVVVAITIPVAVGVVIFALMWDYTGTSASAVHMMAWMCITIGAGFAGWCVWKRFVRPGGLFGPKGDGEAAAARSGTGSTPN